MTLLHTNTTFRAQELSQPLIVIANYFFDTIPQELFWIENQKIEQCLLSLSTESNPSELRTAALIKALKLEYHYQEITPTTYAKEPVLRNLLESYLLQFEGTHLTFPLHRDTLHRVIAAAFPTRTTFY